MFITPQQRASRSLPLAEGKNFHGSFLAAECGETANPEPISDLAFFRIWHQFCGVKDSHEPFPRRRRSASADAAFRQEQARIDAMSLEERVLAALSMRKRFDWLPRNSPPK